MLLEHITVVLTFVFWEIISSIALNVRLVIRISYVIMLIENISGS